MDFGVTASLEMASHVQERLEKEILGAWRAGYNYLYVCPEPDATHVNNGEIDLRVSMGYKIMPKYTEMETNPFDRAMIEYCLKDLNREKVNEHL